MSVKVSEVSRKSTLRVLAIALLAGGAAGCSSDVSRFMYQATDPLTTSSVDRLRPRADLGTGASQAYPGDARQPGLATPDQTQTGSIPGSTARSVAQPGSILSGGGVSRTALPAPGSGQAVTAAESAARVPVGPATQAVTEPSSSPAPRSELASASPANSTPDPLITGTVVNGNGWSAAGGTRVALSEGETIYSLSKRYGVPASEIMKANDLSDASRVAAGQQLVIPVYVYGRNAPVSAPDSDPRTAAAKASGSGTPQPMPQQVPERQAAILPQGPALREPSGTKTETSSGEAGSQPAASPATGTYEVRAGDTLTKIAREHGVGVEALKQANGLSAAAIRIGQKLTIPSGAGAPAAKPDPVVTASVGQEEPKPQAYTAPTDGTVKDSLAETAKVSVESEAPASTGIEKLRWPVRGQVITAYAKSENGKRNDGVDLSVPVGTPVKAAENGVVIYSGDGLQEFGNTVLVRHDNGLVTVYAHNGALNVKRGDKVQRGQTIAASGMSGTAKTPRLHFEVRKNATPVDPTTYLE